MSYIDSFFNCRNSNSEYCIVTNEARIGDNYYNRDIKFNNIDVRLLAGFKLFAFVLLQSWRKRSKEIKQLKQCLDDFKKSNLRLENQNCVYNTLLSVEQRRNDELTIKLKRNLDNLKCRTILSESILMTLSNLNENKILLEDEIKSKHEELNVVYEVLSQTKRELFHCMMEQRNLQIQLKREQRSTQSLKSQITLLVTEICDLNRKYRDKNESFVKHIVDENCKIKNIHHEVDVPKNFEDHGKNNRTDLQLFKSYDLLKDSCNSKRKPPFKFLTQFLKYPKSSLKCIYLFSYYLLPALPPPSFKLAF